jgi:hypothetical protein
VPTLEPTANVTSIEPIEQHNSKHSVRDDCEIVEECVPAWMHQTNQVQDRHHRKEENKKACAIPSLPVEPEHDVRRHGNRYGCYDDTSMRPVQVHEDW